MSGTVCIELEQEPEPEPEPEPESEVIYILVIASRPSCKVPVALLAPRRI